MSVILLIASFFINIAVILILFQIICYGTKKYIKERIKRNLELLDKLEEIEKDIDNKIDGLKIMIYDKYLDRCRVGMKKQREEDKGLRDKLVEVENKYSKQQIHQTIVKAKTKKKKNKILIKKVLPERQKRANGFEAPEKICVMTFF